MKILMISTDRTLLGEQVGDGDVVARHHDYGRQVEKLDIIVFTRTGYQTKKLADNIFCYPTNSKIKLSYFTNAYRIAKQIYAQSNYDLIVCQDPFLAGLAGYLIKRKFKTKLLIHFHGDYWQNKYWLKQSIINYPLLLLSKFTVRQADAIRVVSNGIKKKLVSAQVPTQKINVLPTPVNLEKIQNPDNQTVASIKREFSGQQIVFWVGRFGSEKNLPFLLDSFAQIIKQHPQTVLVLGGNGREFKNIQKLVVKMQLTKNVKLVGRIDYINLPNYFHAADIYVLPSLHESLGKVLIEAGAAGKPSVASATTGAKGIIQDKKTGYLVPINNQKQFVDKVLTLLTNQDLARQMGAAAFKHVQQEYDYRKNVQKIISLWKQIIGHLRFQDHQI